MGALLHQKGIPFTIFELRSQPTEKESQQPSGSLDLHDGSGLAAIKQLGLFEKFCVLANDCTQVYKLADKDGNVLYSGSDDMSVAERPEIARNKLNQLLCDQIPPSSIQWQHKLSSVRRVGQGPQSIELDFGRSNGKKTFDLVIGADGAWSKIRSLVTDVKPKFTNQHYITTSIRNIGSKYPHLEKLVGSGTFMALGDKHGIITQRAANDTVRIYTHIHSPDEQWASKLDLPKKTPAEVKSILLDGKSAPLRRFGPKIKELITTACEDQTVTEPDAFVDTRPVYTLYGTPEGHSWKNQPGVTLLGDAAHLLPPNGEGVNMAMQDAMRLTEAISTAQATPTQRDVSVLDALVPLLEAYEADMFVRADKFAKETGQIIGAMYGSDHGAENLFRFFKEAMSASHTPEKPSNP